MRKLKPSVSLVRQGNEVRVAAGEADLMQFSVGDLYMAGELLAHRVRFRAEGPLRIANLALPWRHFVPERHPARADIRGVATAQGLRVEVRPDTRGGIADVEDDYEFVPDSAVGGWKILRRCRIKMRRTVKTSALPLIRFPDPQGRRMQAWWEIDDPNFDGNYGPSVPMRRDWIGVYEPNCGPETFRKNWRRRVEKYLFRDESGRVSTIRFHRALMWSLSRHNRRALPFRRSGFGGVLHTDGWGTLYEFTDGKPTFGHLCEWGFDTHFWRPLPEVLRKGMVLETSHRIREVAPEEMRRLLRGAKAIEPTAAEWKQAEGLPIYEEPVNRFATSWRDDEAGDAWPWVPGLGATWDLKVGRTQPGSLRLDVPPSAGSDEALWQSSRVGPSNFMNPLVPRARYRLRGYVKFHPAATHPLLGVPGLSITLHGYAGPATFAPEIKPNPVFVGRAAGMLRPGVWTRIEATTTPIASHVLGVTLGCHLHHGGTAWFDELRFERLDP